MVLAMKSLLTALLSLSRRRRFWGLAGPAVALVIAGASCDPRSDFQVIFYVAEGFILFAAMGIILFFLRKLAEQLATPRYGEFAADIRGWFCFGSLLAYGVCGLPAILIAAATDLC